MYVIKTYMLLNIHIYIYMWTNVEGFCFVGFISLAGLEIVKMKIKVMNQSH